MQEGITMYRAAALGIQHMVNWAKNDVAPGFV
jgi:hypothetical protein